jgi:hypothetical protein
MICAPIQFGQPEEAVMLKEITIRSRSGNMALALVGLLYFLAALVTLSFFVVTSWSGASLIDRVLQLALVGSAFAGAFFLHVGAQNLGVHPRLTLRRH